MTFPYPLGAIPSKPDSRDYPAAMRLANVPSFTSAYTLPSAFRLTKMPKVLEQLRGSCMAATLSAFSMKSEVDEAGVALVPDFEAWYDELAIAQFGAQNDVGLMARDSIHSMLTQGPPLGVGRRDHSRIDAYYAVPDLMTARRVIYELRRPVVLVSNIAASWGATTAVGQLWPIGSAWVGPHGWLMWGWDDRPTLGNLIRSSWGTLFGKNGSCYMTNDQWERSFIEAWHLESAR